MTSRVEALPGPHAVGGRLKDAPSGHRGRHVGSALATSPGKSLFASQVLWRSTGTGQLARAKKEDANRERTSPDKGK